MKRLLLFTFLFTNVFLNVKSQEILSNTLILVDFSDSYFNPGDKNRQTKFKDAVDETFSLIKKSIDFVPKNSLIQVLPINNLSLESPILCKIELAETNLIGEPIGGRGIADEEALEIRLNLCKKVIFKQKMDTVTDITGALRKAVYLSDSQAMSDDYRTIIIISDYEEFRGKNTIFEGEEKLDLNNFKFLLVYASKYTKKKGNKTIKIDPRQQAEKFSEKLKSWGAKKVFIGLEDSNFSDKMLKKIF